MPPRPYLLLAACAVFAACGDAPTSGVAEPLPDVAALFDADALAAAPRTVACTLSDGAETRCLSITLTSAPTSFTVGPWCPRHVSDGPELAGIWLRDGRVYDVDGAFIQALPEFYDDATWRLFDPETGKINVTDTQVACEAAARPDVDPAYRNHCVECQIDHIDPAATQTYVIPLEPVPADAPAPRVGHAGVGVAFSGVRLDAPAPLDAILGAHTLAPFDDCGGHVNPAAGYHIHAVTDCLAEVEVEAGHAPQLGLALDGYAIHARLDPEGRDAEGLDACRGHTTETLAYHYHVAAPGENAILGCHTGQTGCTLDTPDAVCDASAVRRRGPPPPR